MATEVVVIRDAVRTALKTSAVATAAGVSASTWAETPANGGHVFDGEVGFLGARNRGRLPFLEFWVEGFTGTRASFGGGGYSDGTVVVRAHVGGADQADAEELAADILAAARDAVRAIADNFGQVGDDSFGRIELGPWGHQMDLRLTLEHAYGS